MYYRECRWSHQLEHLQAPNGTGPGVRRCKRPLQMFYGTFVQGTARFRTQTTTSNFYENNILTFI